MAWHDCRFPDREGSHQANCFAFQVKGGGQLPCPEKKAIRVCKIVVGPKREGTGRDDAGRDTQNYSLLSNRYDVWIMLSQKNYATLQNTPKIWGRTTRKICTNTPPPLHANRYLHLPPLLLFAPHTQTDRRKRAGRRRKKKNATPRHHHHQQERAGHQVTLFRGRGKLPARPVGAAKSSLLPSMWASGLEKTQRSLSRFLSSAPSAHACPPPLSACL